MDFSLYRICWACSLFALQSKQGAILRHARDPSLHRQWWPNGRSQLQLHIRPLGNCCMYSGRCPAHPKPEHSYRVPGMGLCVPYRTLHWTCANTKMHTRTYTYSSCSTSLTLIWEELKRQLTTVQPTLWVLNCIATAQHPLKLNSASGRTAVWWWLVHDIMASV